MEKGKIDNPFGKVPEFNSVSKEFSEADNFLAKLIASVVRNKMEDFHCKYLSNEQMAELNPIIRNAIYTTLVQFRENTETMSVYYSMFVPDYWEDCELLDL